ncbi:uncharacterized protein LOC124635810 [Helicoverpa zea]|uniref:uncharacterized protein LOC124635810 n=2 Tax=Helicoverpa zea TaxID=7113 RepID=UPI001F5967E6|nr:uncharacterized protein LOC124635810 [Helicoverpa zea]
MEALTHKMPSVEIPSFVKANLKHLVLADSDFDKPGDIDLLLGADIFHSIYNGQRLEVGPGLPVALHSVFGWVITGRLDAECSPPAETSTLLASTAALDNVVKRFWEVEEPPKQTIVNPENEKCEQMYTDLVRRNEDGRYVVPMLLKEEHEQLGDSHRTALSRLHNLEKRFLHHEDLKHDYGEFMQEYQDLHHMHQVEPSDTDFRYLIPHHCVIRPDSTSTRLRVVFDASAKTSSGMSLNDIVYTGPKLQNDIVDIITKFRLHKVVFTADVSKMYRNIELRPEDRKYQHILWRSSTCEEVREYELKTVTYGVSSSPFLAIRTLHQLANDHGASWPEAASILRHDTFMDDVTAGAPSVEAALNLKDGIINLLNCGKFELRKWSSNSPEFLAQLPSEHCQVPKSFCDDQNIQTLKILGLQWDPNLDLFTYSQSEFTPKFTKRSILSNVARIYDPLGWLTPMVLKAKLILQALWKLQLNWDDPVPDSIAHQWTEFVSELSYLKQVQIPRHILPSDVVECQLVGFCDGSSKGYGCCIYLRSVCRGKISVKLLIAKSRVAPIKPVTINRLELLGAVLLARVLKHMADLLNPHLKLSRVIAFTDSSTVLSWLNTEPYKLKTFVSHRVVKITDLVQIQNWYHVSTSDNPADHSSRGLSCSQLIASDTWWSGPSWLSLETSEWPVSQDVYVPPGGVPEVKSLPVITHSADLVPLYEGPIKKLLSHYSSFSRVQRALAWLLRFSKVLRKLTFNCKTLTVEELENSLSLLVQHEQTEYFANEIESVKCARTCSRPIQKLNPFLDHRGLLRVGGRLVNSKLPLSEIYPLLLPKNSRLSALIVDYFHKLHLHCGPRMLQSIISRRFWILGIRNLIRSRLSKCVTCFKVNPTSVSPIMGNLPAPRVQPSRCFSKIGIDFAGPFIVKESKRRKAPVYKVYVCVMVCLAVKAIHLELVTDLSTSAFIAALDRFVSRRGLCQLIISDCGTNFVGAKRYLSEVHQFLSTQESELNTECTKRNIVWQHNPPTASHFGGIFESGVKSMKYHLKRVVGLQVLTFEEMLTVLNKVEAVLNSRPLCALSSDPTEVDVLTPGHFITGGPLVSLPEIPLTDTYWPPKERWQLLQKMTQSFWKGDCHGAGPFCGIVCLNGIIT